MIRTEIVADLKPLYDLQLFMQAFPTLFQDSVYAAFDREVRPHLLAELQYEPPAAKLPFPFETEKSRRYYMWLVRTGKVKTANGHYVRSHKLSRGWKVGLSIDDELIVLSAENKARYEKWVTGPRQVRGHAASGWIKRQLTIDYWADASAEVAVQQIDAVLSGKFMS